MDTLKVPVSGMNCIKKASERIRLGKTPVNLWGVSGTALPLVMETLRGDTKQLLVVVKDDASADRLAADYRFYDRDVFIYPAKDVLFIMRTCTATSLPGAGWRSLSDCRREFPRW